MEEMSLAVSIARLRGLTVHLKQHIYGQEEACEQISQVFWQGELGLRPTGLPRGSALLVGPTGTGKTELVRQVAQYWFVDSAQDRLHRYDMANFRQEESLSLLIGHTGQRGMWGELFDRIANTPSILLFDELEKAHPSVFNLFLAMLDTGSLCCADGRRRDLTPHYLFFTSNLASADMVRMEHLPRESLQRFVHQQMEQILSPELTARLQTRVLLRPISRTVLGKLVQKELAQQLAQIESCLSLTIHPHPPEIIKNWIHNRVSWEYSRSRLGARMIRDTVACLLQQSLFRYLQENSFQHDQPVWLSIDADRLCFSNRVPNTRPTATRALLPGPGLEHAAQQTNQPINTE